MSAIGKNNQRERCEVTLEAVLEVVLEVVLPSGRKLGEVVVLHGEERSVQLGDATELKLLLMRVDSPEFRALMQLKPGAGRGTI